jgi:sn-glycerol 3-phosphate transport system permease protein
MNDSAAFKSRWLHYVLLAPTMVIVLIFLYYPAIQGFVLSLHRSNIRLGTRAYVGLENFVAIFTGPFAPEYMQIIWQSLLFSLLVVSIGLSISVVLATFANQPVAGARVYRLLLIWPFALSPAVAGTIFLFLFNPEVGTVNQILQSTFGIRPRWLDTPALAFGLVVAAAVWKNLGYNIVFYLAALQNVPAELSEAAEIDGAGPVQRFFRITLPLLSPMTFFLVFTNLTFSFFDAFAIIDIMTRGGPIHGNTGATTIMMYRVFQEGIQQGRAGIAAAYSVLILVLVIVFTSLQFRYGSRHVHYGGS